MELVRRFLEDMEIEWGVKDRILFMHFLYFFERLSDEEKQKLLLLIVAQGRKQQPLRPGWQPEADGEEVDLEFDREMHQRFVVDMQPLRDKTGFISIKG